MKPGAKRWATLKAVTAEGYPQEVYTGPAENITCDDHGVVVVLARAPGKDGQLGAALQKKRLPWWRVWDLDITNTEGE